MIIVARLMLFGSLHSITLCLFNELQIVLAIDMTVKASVFTLGLKLILEAFLRFKVGSFGRM